MNGPVRVTAAAVAAGALTGSLVFSLLWLLRPESFWFVLITSYTPYALLGYLVALPALLVLRRGLEQPLRRWISVAMVVAVAGVAFHVSLLAPAFVGSHPSGPADLTVISLNMRVGHGDAAAAVALVRKEKAQVVVLEEVTPALQQRLVTEGLPTVLPYVAGAPGLGASGTMVFSSYPLTETAALPLHHRSYRVRVAAPVPFWLIAVHAAQPIKDASDWRADWSVLNQVVPALDGSVILAGDFNTTLDHAPMRDLIGDGFVDAAQQANSGWQPTYPSVFGLIAIDHVITRGKYAAVSTATDSIGGTDHHALVARLAVQ